MTTSNLNFIVIYIIHKMFVLIRNNQNYLKDSICECFFKEHNRILFFRKQLFLFIVYNNGKFKY